MNQITSASVRASVYLWSVIGNRAAAMREAADRRDRGASAIELAIITALIAVAAATVAGIIVAVIGKKSSIIHGL
jgi:Flp pilus assembly pilin Flp